MPLHSCRYKPWLQDALLDAHALVVQCWHVEALVMQCCIRCTGAQRAYNRGSACSPVQDRQWTPMDKMALPMGALDPSTATRVSDASDTSLYSNTPPYEVPGRATRRHSNVFDWSQLLAESQVRKSQLRQEAQEACRLIANCPAR